MRQNYCELEPFTDSELTALFAQIKRDEMCDLFCESWCDLSAHSQYSAFNGLFVASGDVPATYNNITHEECWIWTIRSRILHLVDLQRRCDPCRLDDMYHEIQRAVVVGEV